jgi:hypothetical protein
MLMVEVVSILVFHLVAVFQVVLVISQQGRLLVDVQSQSHLHLVPSVEISSVKLRLVRQMQVVPQTVPLQEAVRVEVILVPGLVLAD